ncbi:MAG: O-methyltransferase [Chloroflexota bacterium]
MDERPIADPELEAYAAAHSTAEPPWLAAAAAATRRDSTRHGMMVGHLVGRFLSTIVAIQKPRLVLEFGTFTGYSALCMAESLPAGGRIISLELDPAHAAMAQRHIDASPYADRIEIRVGPALDSVAGIAEPVDLAFIDADKQGYIDYYEAAMARLAPDGLIVADNVLWNGLVLDPAPIDDRTVPIQRFNEHVAADPRVQSVMLTLRDGVTLIRRKT